MISILDVSGAIQVILEKEKAEKFDKIIKSSEWVLAPDLYVSEISNVLWKYHRAKIITHNDCIQYIEDGIKMIDDYIDAKELWKEAIGEGIRNDHSIYDMYYAVLARRNDAILITNDGDLAQIGENMGITVCY